VLRKAPSKILKQKMRKGKKENEKTNGVKARRKKEKRQKKKEREGGQGIGKRLNSTSRISIFGHWQL